MNSRQLSISVFIMCRGVILLIVYLISCKAEIRQERRCTQEPHDVNVQRRYTQEPHEVYVQDYMQKECFALKYESLILEGGGLKGLAYAGAAKALAEHGYFSNNVWQFKNLTGTSIGCLFGYFLALDISAEGIEKIVLNTDFRSIFYKDVRKLFQIPIPPNSNSYFTEKISYFYELMQYVRRLMFLWMKNNSPGLSNGSDIKRWILQNTIKYSPYRNVITENTTMREFEDITQHRLTCYATKISSKKDIKLLTLNAETAPDQTVLKVLYASMSLPLIFKPLRGTAENTAILDGGLLLNFPIYSQDWNGRKNQRVLGLSLHTDPTDSRKYKESNFGQPGEDDDKPIYSTIKMLKLIQNIIYSTSASAFIQYSTDANNWDRIIYLNASSLPTIAFDLTKEDISHHTKMAYIQTINFLKRQYTKNFHS